MDNQPSSTPTHLFPRRKIRSYDGMAVTAEVWEQAHAYHEQALRAHALNLHGTGILSGLEVIASDPPERIVYILPGAAVDPTGQVIVLPEPVAYDIGSDMEGPLYLLISHRQSASGSAADESSPVYSEDQFLISATPALLDQPGIELARFTCESRFSHLMDARNALCPKINEIDLRHRAILVAQSELLVTAGTAYLGQGKSQPHGKGLARISRELRHTSRLHLVVDDDIQLGPNVVRYNMLYLVGQGAFKVSASVARGLQGYLQRGGMLFLESCDAEATSALIELCGQLGVGLKPVTADHPLLSEPYLFDCPPSGSLPGGELLAAAGNSNEDSEGPRVVLSTYGYGPLWAGETAPDGNQQGRRAQMRAAVEFAGNLFFYQHEHRVSA